MIPKKSRGLIVYFVLFLGLMLAATLLFNQGTAEERPNYDQIIKYFYDEQVTEYTLDFGTGELVLTLKAVEKPIIYKVPNVNLFINDTHEYVKKQNEKTPGTVLQKYKEPQQTPFWISFLPTLFIVAVLGVFWFVMLRQTRGGGNVMSFAKAKVKMADSGPKVTFSDVAGADEEKEELVEIVQFLRDPQKFNDLGARIPKGVLLMGPPGTGKTLLAKAVAGEANAPFFSISGSDFVEMFVGVGAGRVRDLFDQAKKAAPSIIFIDEIDAVGRHRGAGMGGGHDEREQTLNQLLVEMDGFAANVGVIVIAATNRKDILDPALLRPGRFDRHITVGFPDIKGREEILKIHSRNKPIAPDVELKTVAKSTGGFTGADLENLLNEAALLAGRRGYKAITMAEIEEATIKVIVGPEKRSHAINEKNRRLTAYHEAGHAIVTYNCATQDKVHQISIIPRGWAGGFTLALPESEKIFHTKNEMFESIVVLLGGRVSEKLVLEDISTGASNDIQRATAIARAMVTQYGFSEKLGTVVYGRGSGSAEVFMGRDFGHEKDFSESIAAEIDGEIRTIIDNAYNKAKEILQSNLDNIEKVAQYLLINEKVDGEDFAKLMRGEEPAVKQPVEPLKPLELPAQNDDAPALEDAPEDASAPAPEETPAQDDNQPQV